MIAPELLTTRRQKVVMTWLHKVDWYHILYHELYIMICHELYVCWIILFSIGWDYDIKSFHGNFSGWSPCPFSRWIQNIQRLFPSAYPYVPLGLVNRFPTVHAVMDQWTGWDGNFDVGVLEIDNLILCWLRLFFLCLIQNSRRVNIII